MKFIKLFTAFAMLALLSFTANADTQSNSDPKPTTKAETADGIWKDFVAFSKEDRPAAVIVNCGVAAVFSALVYYGPTGAGLSALKAGGFNMAGFQSAFGTIVGGGAGAGKAASITNLMGVYWQASETPGFMKRCASGVGKYTGYSTLGEAALMPVDVIKSLWGMGFSGGEQEL